MPHAPDDPSRQQLPPEQLQQVLDAPMPQPNDAGADTVGDYLLALLRQAWRQGESFSGKRPFGNSGHEHAVADALVYAGVLDPAVAGDLSLTQWLVDQALAASRLAVPAS